MKERLLALALATCLSGCSKGAGSMMTTPALPSATPASVTLAVGQSREADTLRLEAALQGKAYTDLTSARFVLRETVLELLQTERYKELEQLLAQSETSKVDWGDGLTLAQEVYQAAEPESRESLPRYTYFLDRWQSVSKSHYPELLKASMLTRCVLRDSRFRNFEERQQLLADSTLASGALYQASLRKECLADPEYWESCLRLSVLTRDPRERLDRYFGEVLRRDPQRWSAAVLRSFAEHPYWNDGGDPVGYVATIDALSQRHGPEVYAACAWFAYAWTDRREGAFRMLKFDPEKVHQGFEALRQRSPHSRTLLSEQARLAWVLGDEARTRTALERLGSDWDRQVWPSAASYHTACRTAGLRSLETVPERAVLTMGPEKAFLEKLPRLRRLKLAEESRGLLREDRFEVLESLIAALRKGDERHLASFYEAFEPGDDKALAEVFLGGCERWRAALPDSATVNVVEAGLLIDAAWSARGAGWAREVSKEGWKLFVRDLDKAADLLERSKLPDGYAASYRITVAMGRSEAPAVVERVVEQAALLDPKGTKAASSQLVYLLPRWHGDSQSLAEGAKRLMKRQGDGALALAMLQSGYREALAEDLPYALIDRSLRALEADPSSPAESRELRAWVERYREHPEKAKPWLLKAAKEGEVWYWGTGNFQAYVNHAAGGPAPLGPTAKVVESGQYQGLLSGPKKLETSASLPIVAGRSLGLKVRHGRDVPIFVDQAIELRRPPAPGEQAGADGLVTVWKRSVRPPGTFRAGGEELFLWDIQPGEQAPGPWTLTVYANDGILASHTFSMASSDLPEEPGVHLQFRGQVDGDRRGLSIPSPIVSTRQIPLRLGSAMGVFFSYTIPVKEARMHWIVPPREKGGKPTRETIALDFSDDKLPARPRYFLERPEELVPGKWAMELEVNGRSVGEVEFDLAP